LAGDLSPQVRVERREAAEQAWREALGVKRAGGKSPAKPTVKMQRAAAKAAAIALVEYLARCSSAAEGEAGTGRPPSPPVEQARRLGDLLYKECFEEVRREAAQLGAGYSDMGKLASGHFWCSLLASLAGAADRTDGVLETVPDEAKAVLAEGAEPPGWGGGVQGLICDGSLRFVWGCATRLLGDVRVEDLVLIMRILAVFICRDPARHPEIYRLCLLPLGQGVLGDAVDTMLRESFGGRQ